MDANERYERVKELVAKREGFIAQIDGELSALFLTPPDSKEIKTRLCRNCGKPGHNAASCKEPKQPLSTEPDDTDRL